MNMRLGLFVCAVVLSTALSGLAETVYLVQITDIRKSDAWEVMTREEVSKLQKEVQEESRVFPAALAAAKKAWDADELLKKTAFPGSSLAPRKVSSQGPFTNREQADKKKQSRDERQSEAMLKEAKAKMARNNVAEALRQQNIDKALDKLNQELSKALKRDVPLNGL